MKLIEPENPTARWIATGASCVLIVMVLAGLDSSATAQGDELDEEAKLVASDAAAFDGFGGSVSLSGDTAIIGAYLDDEVGGLNSGSAYILVRNGTAWTEQAKLVASDAAPSDSFGVSVSLSGDTALVGARLDTHAGGSAAGSAYVFVRNGTSWTEQAKLAASDAAPSDSFGVNVSLSGDTAIVGAYQDDTASGPDAGSAYIFVRNGTTWGEQAKLVASDASTGDWFGYSVSLSGDTALVGSWLDDHAAATQAGSAYVFVRNGTTWTEQAKLVASDAGAFDNFGISVSLSGDTAIVGAHADGNASGLYVGSAYVFVRNGTAWTEQAKLVASDAADADEFGISVSLSGDTALVGAFRDSHVAGFQSGSAYVFLRKGAGWTEQAKLVASDARNGDSFGISASLWSDTAIVGANSVTIATAIAAGSAYVYDVSLNAFFTASPTSGLAPLTVSFRDASLGLPTSWLWDFGDGSTSTEQHPAHTYTDLGSYTVSLSISDGIDSDVEVKPGFIDVVPLTADFTATPVSGIAPLTVAFFDASDPPASSWSWDFGDGFTSALQNPTHTYTLVGAYTVSLSASDGINSDVEVKTEFIEVVPLSADFTATPVSGHAPLTVAFFDASDALASSWSWDFGDGFSSTLQNPTHTYTLVGTYTVSLVASTGVSSDVETKPGFITALGVAFVGALGSPGSCTIRNDAGNVNPLVLDCLTDPIIGTTWQSHFDAGSIGGSGFTIQVGTPALLRGVALSFGVLLIDLTQPVLALTYGIVSGGGSTHSVPVPNDPSLTGLPVYVQGYIDNVGGVGKLTNGLDLVLGP